MSNGEDNVGNYVNQRFDSPMLNLKTLYYNNSSNVFGIVT